MKVCKFGGSSVASSSQIKKVADILNCDKKRMIAVVSAPGKRVSTDDKITDLLYKAASLSENGEDISQVFDMISSRYLEIAESLELGTDEIKRELDTIKTNIRNGKGRAYAASRGEYLSARLISKYLGWNFLDPEGVIVIGDDNKIEDITYTLLSSLIKKGEKYVVPGFYGTSLSGEVTTFSRGGSDITGAIVAAAVSADVYENWTDVSGVYSSDPRLVNSARVIEELSYREVREFSSVGASVFHEEAIAPCIEKNIPINIRNTNSPLDKGTIIRKSVDRKGVVGVSAKTGMGVIYCHKLLLFKDENVEKRILSLLSECGIKPSHKVYGADSISLYADAKSMKDEALSLRLKDTFKLDEVKVCKDYALLALVGNRIDETCEYISALSALKDEGIIPSSISFDEGGTTFLMAIKEDESRKALNVVSDKLFGKH